MNDRMFWERFDKLAEKVKDGSGSAVYNSNRSKSITLIKVKKSKRENEVGRYAIGNCSYYEDYDVLGEYELKSGELLPSFFDVVATGTDFKSLIKAIDMRAHYNLERAVKAYRKHLTLKKIVEWLNEKEVDVNGKKLG